MRLRKSRNGAPVHLPIALQPSTHTRRVHFFAMATIALFLCVHVLMAALVPKTLRAMIRGR